MERKFEKFKLDVILVPLEILLKKNEEVLSVFLEI